MASIAGENKETAKKVMTSVAGATTVTTAASSAADLVGRHGEALFGKQNPKWYPCVVKADNNDGTIKVQWDEDKKYTSRLPVEKFKPDADVDDDEEPGPDIPMNIFAPDEGDY